MAEFIELLKALPGLIWALTGAAALWLLAPHVARLLPRLEGFEGFGLKLSLKALQDAVQARPSVATASVDATRATERLKRDGRRLDGAEILWVDDHPSGNRREARIFLSLGANITFAASSAEAEPLARGMDFHVIISDVRRDGVQDEGIRMLGRLRAQKVGVPVIFYTASARQPPPPGAQGITDRPDVLVNLVLDALAVRAA